MQIFISKNGQKFGPYPLEEVNQHLADGVFKTSDLAWHDGLPNWLPLSLIPGITGRSIPSAPPPIPVHSNIASKGTITAGYICAGISLLLFPPGFGIAGLVLGIITLIRGHIAHGIAIIVLSVTLGLFGWYLGGLATS